MRALTPRVVATLEKIAPRQYADLSWDNVGLLVDAVDPPATTQQAVALSLDLSVAVIQECIAKQCGVLVCYHPVIFPSLKCIVKKNPKQHALLLAIRHGISIISPHTALDNCPNGINEWIARGVLNLTKRKVSFQSTYLDEESRQGNKVTIAAGGDSLTFSCLIAAMKRHFGVDTVRCAFSDGCSEGSVVRTIGICAGSGSSVFRPYAGSLDCVISGEIGHHDILNLQHSGTTVLLVEHGTSERGFLQDVLHHSLSQALNDDTNTEPVSVHCLESDKSLLTYL